jgi:hypothetical protein
MNNKRLRLSTTTTTKTTIIVIVIETPTDFKPKNNFRQNSEEKKMKKSYFCIQILIGILKMKKGKYFLLAFFSFKKMYY